MVVDQFEELFRDRAASAGSRDDAIAFVKLLLDASGQTDVPIYVVLTMRSDFIGDCMEYPGLPEAINDESLSRPAHDARRTAVGHYRPVAVAGGSITPRLVQRLLNDVVDDQDRLPVLQHALMRMWDYWSRRPDPKGRSISPTISRSALCVTHCLVTPTRRIRDRSPIAPVDRRRVFRALTDTVTDPRGVRRPSSVAAFAAVGEASDAKVTPSSTSFVAGRSFLMPPPALR